MTRISWKGLAGWALDRLAEPSTYAGIGLLVSAAGYAGLGEKVTIAGVSIAGVFSVAIKERGA
jgi:hypothetical protein